MFSILHAFILRGSGLFHVLTAMSMAVLAVAPKGGEPDRITAYGVVAFFGFIGLWLLTTKAAWLTNPRSYFQAFNVLLTAIAIGGLSMMGAVVYSRALELESMMGLSFLPGAVLLGSAGSLLLLSSILLVSKNAQAELEAEATSNIPLEQRKRFTKIEIAAMRSVAPRDNLAIKLVVALDWLAQRTIAVVLAVLAVVLLQWFFSEDPRLASSFGDLRRPTKGVFAVAIFAAVLLWPFPPATTFWHRPYGFRAVILKVFTVGIGAAMVYYLAPIILPQVELPYIGAYVAPYIDRIPTAAIALLAFSTLCGLLIAPTGPSMLQLAEMAGIGNPQKFAKIRATRSIERKNAMVPKLNGILKVYMVADWFVMRLIGLGLLGVAYMQWLLIEGGRTFRAAAIAFDYDPMWAVYAYAGVGALLAIPSLLPAFIAKPRHIIGGMIKACIVSLSGTALYGPILIAIPLYTPEQYHLTLNHLAVPIVSSIIGFAFTGALLNAFFRHLSGTTKINYKGEEIRVISSDELRDLRAARMQLSA